MGKSYRPYYPDEDLLLPPSLRDWLPEKHLAYFVSDVVDHLDLSAMDAVYGNEKRGQPPYDPQMMTKVLVYGYCVGVFSSRRIERRLVEDIAFRVLGAEGTREGGGRGRRSERNQTEREGSIQLHRSAIAHHERRGWLCASL